MCEPFSDSVSLPLSSLLESVKEYILLYTCMHAFELPESRGRFLDLPLMEFGLVNHLSWSDLFHFSMGYVPYSLLVNAFLLVQI